MLTSLYQEWGYSRFLTKNGNFRKKIKSDQVIIGLNVTKKYSCTVAFFSFFDFVGPVFINHYWNNIFFITKHTVIMSMKKKDNPINIERLLLFWLLWTYFLITNLLCVLLRLPLWKKNILNILSFSWILFLKKKLKQMCKEYVSNFSSNVFLYAASICTRYGTLYM